MKVASNRIQDVYRHYVAAIKGQYPAEEARKLITMLIEEYAGLSKTELMINPALTLNESELLKVHFAVKALKDFKPIQQILGYALFCGCRIGVDGHVLIPRPETEEMVEKIKIENFPAGPRILDIGSGSGAIAIALKKHFTESSVFALEKSPKAIRKASENAVNNSAEIYFIHADLFDEELPENLPVNLDLIVSNPPYVRESERSEMQPNVLEYEPVGALFVSDESPLTFYERIAEIAPRLLATNGILYLEINEGLGEETRELFVSSGYEAVLMKDLFGKDRFIRALKA